MSISDENPAPTADPPPEDHRTRSGAARREKTRKKLLSAALKVFADKGLDAPLIEDFIAAAGVARGTFYNYFNATGDLMAAVTAELGDEILVRIDAEVRKQDTPLRRMTCGCLLYMETAIDHPVWGHYIARTGLRHDAVGQLLDVYLPRDLENAAHAGAVRFATLRAARDLVFGVMIQTIISITSGAAPRSHIRDTFQMTLQGLGVSAAEAAELAAMALPAIEMPSGFGFSEVKKKRRPAP